MEAGHRREAQRRLVRREVVSQRPVHHKSIDGPYGKGHPGRAWIRIRRKKILRVEAVGAHGSGTDPGGSLKEPAGLSTTPGCGYAEHEEGSRGSDEEAGESRRQQQLGAGS